MFREVKNGGLSECRHIGIPRTWQQQYDETALFCHRNCAERTLKSCIWPHFQKVAPGSSLCLVADLLWSGFTSSARWFYRWGDAYRNDWWFAMNKVRVHKVFVLLCLYVLSSLNWLEINKRLTNKFTQSFYHSQAHINTHNIFVTGSCNHRGSKYKFHRLYRTNILIP